MLKSRVATSKCGFIIHPAMGWFGASLDVQARDPHLMVSQSSSALTTPHEACKDPNFYCFYDGGLHLKHSHQYYHQVQFQLFVRIDLYDWCDFCVYTPKGKNIT